MSGSFCKCPGVEFLGWSCKGSDETVVEGSTGVAANNTIGPAVFSKYL